MKKTFGLISVAAIATALTLTIAFSGVALASQPVKPTKETECIYITTDIICVGNVVESQGLSLESSSTDLLDIPPLEEGTGKGKQGEKYGKIKYDEKMIGSSGTTEFDKCLEVDTGTTPNLAVEKQIGYKQGPLGSLSHDEQVGMTLIAAGGTKITKTTENILPRYINDHFTEEEQEWKKELCPFKKRKAPKKTIPGSCEEVHAYSEMVMTDVSASTRTEVGITASPVNLLYEIDATAGGTATGTVAAGVSVYVEDGRGYKVALGSRMSYKEKSVAYGEIERFYKKIGYTSEPPPT